ncbi:hypothetical protein ZWY2020_019763 [Hordeum vulgare]|nr:hypothetical protein ZWY2020_019763 [Hordeum vulgare]
MYPPKILTLLFFLPLTYSSSRLTMNKSFALNAELGTIWRNNPSLLHNISPDDNFSLRIILPKEAFMTSVNSYYNSIPSFACGFFCAGAVSTCDDYIFSVLFVSVYSFHAEVYLFAGGGLNRQSGAVKSCEYGDLRSFDHPSDTLVTGQVLQVGQKLMASTSMENRASGIFYLTVLPDGMYAFAGTDTPLAYYQSPTGGTVMTNKLAYVALKDGSLRCSLVSWIQRHRITRSSCPGITMGW